MFTGEIGGLNVFFLIYLLESNFPFPPAVSCLHAQLGWLASTPHIKKKNPKQNEKKKKKKQTSHQNLIYKQGYISTWQKINKCMRYGFVTFTSRLFTPFSVRWGATGVRKWFHAASDLTIQLRHISTSAAAAARVFSHGRRTVLT